MKRTDSASTVGACVASSSLPRSVWRCSEIGYAKVLKGRPSRWRNWLALSIAVILGVFVTLIISPVLLAIAIASWLGKKDPIA